MNRPRRIALSLVALVGLGVGPGASPVAAAATQRLPDLAVVAPYEFRIVINDETGQKRLRFTTLVVNLGPGPFRLYGYDEDGKAVRGDELLVRQRVRMSDGTWVDRDTNATMFWSGDGHNHFHVTGLQLIKIETLDGKVLGKARKLGFCFMDSYRWRSDKPSVFNADNYVCNPAPDGRVPMGITPLWGDIYRSTIAHQWIDISDLPDGDYRIKVVADPPYNTPGQFLEANETNNRGMAKIRISGMTVRVLSHTASP